MCGISGIFFLNTSSNIKSTDLQKMNSVIRHRGPDDEGFILFEKNREKPEIFGGKDTPEEIFHSSFSYCPHERLSDKNDLSSVDVILSHRRLKIIDLSSAGHQPMSYDNDRYWITYNGEIYNWIELRGGLEGLGHKFVSHSDTEVILASYAQWGKDCLTRFNGMWAFIIFDKKTKTIFAARDRFGIKPLYWYIQKGFLAIASEIKQFTVLPGWNATLNRSQAQKYLISGVIDDSSETFFSGVFQIRGGEAVHCNIDQISENLPIYRWYQIKSVSHEGINNEIYSKFRNLLTDSIRLRLRADVKVGSCLSGGLDSSTIVCIINNIFQEDKIENNQKTFSACSEIKRLDEREYVDEVLNGRAIEPYFICPTVADLKKDLDKIIWHQDEPFGSTSIFAQWQVFALASKNSVKVMLDGQGADEQLCGYFSFFDAECVDLLKNLQLVNLITEIKTINKIHKISIINLSGSMIIRLLPIKIRNFLLKYKRRSYIVPDWGTENTGSDFIFSIGKSEIQKEIHSQIFSTNLPMLLHWEDRNSMAHSIESRVPFLDYRIVEFLYSVPDELKVKNGITKVILRKAMSEILPNKICWRMDKIGFVTAEEFWMTKNDPKFFQELLEESIKLSNGIIKKDVSTHLKDMIEGKMMFSSMIWRIICFGRWVKIFNVSGVGKDPLLEFSN